MTSIRRKVGFLALAFLLAVMFCMGLAALMDRHTTDNAVVMDSQWVVEYHGQKFAPKSLTQFKPITGNVIYGDSLFFDATMPSNLSGYSFLRIRLFVSAMDVYLNDEKIYSYGRELMNEGGIIGSGYHRIFLPSGWEGKHLSMHVYAAESGAFDIMPEMTLLRAESFGTLQSALHLSPAFCLAVFMCLFGIMAIIGGIGAMGYAAYFYRMPFIGLFSFVLGIWTVCYTHEIQLISSNLELNAIVEYATLYFAPITIELLLVTIRYRKMRGWRWNALVSLLVFNSLFFVVTTFLQIFNIANYSHFLAPFHVGVLAGGVFLMMPGVIFSRRDSLPVKIAGIGLLIFCLSGVAEIGSFLLNHMYPGIDPRSNPIVPWGVLAYLMSLLVSYAMYLQKAIANKTEKELLSSLAYRDALTGLYNRAKCEQIFDALNGISSDYSITSIDMNGLKKVNDTFGHERGDEMLKAFACTLSESFKGIGTPIRMGGDEFLLVVRQEHLNDFDEAIEKMKHLQEEASRTLPIPLSASYGTALRSEVRSTAEDVYRFADGLMYKMKKESKESRKD